MKYDVISADCHVDLIWLPPDLFTANAPAVVKDRMPYVTDGPRGKEWVTKNGASLGSMPGWVRLAGNMFRARSTAPTEWPRPGFTRTAGRASAA